MEIIEHIILLQQFVGSVKPKTKDSQTFNFHQRCRLWSLQSASTNSDPEAFCSLRLTWVRRGPPLLAQGLQSTKIVTSVEEKKKKRKEEKILSSYIPLVMPRDLTNSPKYILR